MAAQSEIVSGARKDEALAYLQSVLEYEEELRALNSEALLALIADEHDKDRQAEMEQAAKLESERFFNKPTARAYYRSWVERNHWTLDEATALILGKDPKVVNWDSIDPIVHKSAFARRYESLRRQFLRARFDGMLFEPLVPADFLRYAKSIGFALPIELDRLLQSDDEQRARSQQRALDEIQLAKLRKAIEEAATPREMEFAPPAETDYSAVATDEERAEEADMALPAEAAEEEELADSESDETPAADPAKDMADTEFGAADDDDGEAKSDISAEAGTTDLSIEAQAADIAREISAMIGEEPTAGFSDEADDSDRAEVAISIDELAAELEADLSESEPEAPEHDEPADEAERVAGVVEERLEQAADSSAEHEPLSEPEFEQGNEAVIVAEPDFQAEPDLPAEPDLQAEPAVEDEPEAEPAGGIEDTAAIADTFVPARPATIADIAEELIRHTRTLTTPNGAVNGAQARPVTDFYRDDPEEFEADGEETADDLERMPANERETLLRIFLAMAVGRYGYEPDSKRNSTVTDIVRDHEKIGLSVSATTVRKWLREASKMMPADES
ncbi:MAG TPA: hypothetical protein VK862_16520 [Afifellaceae bacterium]|nr:hypothetical protein [Afifellaceae bacterium]